MDDTESKSVLGMRTPGLVVVTSLVLGGIALLLSYFTGRFARQHKNSDISGRQKQIVEKVIDDSANSLRESGKNSASTTGNSNGNASGNTTSGKRAKNKKRREAQQEFTHSWMVGALKGHTGPVLDMNFASNGKFLASCAEDCDLMLEAEFRGHASSGYGEDVLSSTNRYKVLQPIVAMSTGISRSGPSSSPTTAKTSKVQVEATSPSTLSRRQRKNRTRGPRDPQRRDRDDYNDNDDESPVALHHHRHKNAVGPSPPRYRHHHRVLQHHKELNSHHFHQENQKRAIPTSAPSSAKSSETSSRSHWSSGQSYSHQQSSSSKAPANDINNGFYVYGAGNSVVLVNNVSGGHANNTGNSAVVKNSNDSSIYSQRLSSMRNELSHLSDAALMSYLSGYVLTDKDRSDHCYPYENVAHPGQAMIERKLHPRSHRARVRQRPLDANAREFVPGNYYGTIRGIAAECETDSGNGSGSSVENSDLEPECSSDSDKGSDTGEFYSSSSSSSSSNYAQMSRRDSRSSTDCCTTYTPAQHTYHAIERSCVRCHKSFYLNSENGEYIYEEVCVYHWGKFRYDQHMRSEWECCKGDWDAKGCTIGRTHVWTGLVPGVNGPFKGYVRTRPSPVVGPNANHGAYALDCEMCFTRRGLELTKVTIVAMDGRVVYNSLVKPDDEVIDHNTRFSGITYEDLAKATKSLRDVQNDITQFVYAETILIGHGLENDLRALRLFHDKVIDTSSTFPHRMGLPLRNSLKYLATKYLGVDIQVGEHDPVEDASIAAELILKLVQHHINGGKKSFPKESDRHNDMPESAQHNHIAKSAQHNHMPKSAQHNHMAKSAQHNHMAKSAQHNHMAKSAQHNHMAKSAQHNHMPESAQHNHMAKSAQHNLTTESAQHYRVAGSAQHNHIPGSAQHNHVAESTQHYRMAESAQHNHMAKSAQHNHMPESAHHHLMAESARHNLMTERPYHYFIAEDGQRYLIAENGQRYLITDSAHRSLVAEGAQHMLTWPGVFRMIAVQKR